MRHILQILTAITVFLIVFSLGMHQGNTKSDGSPLANTGSPGDGSNNTCAKFGCHVGTVNAFPGAVSIDASSIPSSGYAPGRIYNLVVTVTESGRNTFGFQLTAEDNNQNKMGTYSGNTAVRLEFNDWVTHRMNSGTGVFSFDWVAPFSNEEITFYAAGNAANSNGSASGDHIYTSSSAPIKRDPLQTSVRSQSPNLEKLFYNMQLKTLSVTANRSTFFNLHSLSGQLVANMNVGIGNNTITMASIQPGVYILMEPQTGYTYRFVVN